MLFTEITKEKILKGETYMNDELQELVLDYLNNQTSQNFEKLYLKLRTMINVLVASTSMPDKAELTAIAEDTLLKCLRCYDTESDTKFSTYYSASVKMSFRFYYRTNKNHLNVSSLDYISSQNDNESVLDTLIEPTTDDFCTLVETEATLESVKSYLTDNELKVCKIILAKESKISKTDLAKEMEMTTSGVAYLLNKVGKKVKEHNLFSYVRN